MTCLGIIVLVAMCILERGCASGGRQPRTGRCCHSDATAAAKASPELVGALSKEMGATPEQAAGAAGALFGMAKSRLKPEEFSQIATAVPGMDSLLKAAPAAGGGATSSTLSQFGSGAAASNLAGAASAFSKLGLSSDMVGKAVPVLTSYVTKSGGPKVGGLLAGCIEMKSSLEHTLQRFLVAVVLIAGAGCNRQQALSPEAASAKGDALLKEMSKNLSSIQTFAYTVDERRQNPSAGCEGREEE